MKLRTLSEFEDAVDAETAWRRRELTTVIFNVRESRQSKVQVSLRAGIALLYGHWEGWIKAVATLYVSYVDQQKLTYSEMSDAFLGSALKSRLAGVVGANSSSVHVEFAAFLQAGGLNERGHISAGLIRTESNLSSKVLSDILTRLGLSHRPYDLLAVLIDERLVGARNRVAHGEYLEVDAVQYEDLHGKVLNMLVAFTTDVRNAAATKAYRAASDELAALEDV